MPDLNFDELRAAVEEETYLPEFVEIRRRARRHKRWRVLINAARLIGVLIIATPAFAVGDVVFTHIYNPQAAHHENGDDKANTGIGTAQTPSPSDSIATQSVVAVDGINPTHLYALEDICFGDECDLQLTLVNPTAADPVTPAVGLLRTKPTDRLIDPRLVVESTSLAYVSAVVNAGTRVSQPVPLDPGTGAVEAVLRPVQTVFQGPIQYLKAGVIENAPGQPPVNQPMLASDQGGWWVCGISSANDLAVAVSHDEGQTWHSSSTEIPLDGAMPDGITGAALATSDGAQVYVLVHSYNQTTLARSIDGGASWRSVATSMVWPDATAYNLVITRTGKLIASFTGVSTSYFISSDNGATFQPLANQPMGGGLIVYAGGEFMTLGRIPSISQDGQNWQAAYVPYVTVQAPTPTN